MTPLIVVAYAAGWIIAWPRAGRALLEFDGSTPYVAAAFFGAFVALVWPLAIVWLVIRGWWLRAAGIDPRGDT